MGGGGGEGNEQVGSICRAAASDLLCLGQEVKPAQDVLDELRAEEVESPDQRCNSVRQPTAWMEVTVVVIRTWRAGVIVRQHGTRSVLRLHVCL